MIQQKLVRSEDRKARRHSKTGERRKRDRAKFKIKKKQTLRIDLNCLLGPFQIRRRGLEEFSRVRKKLGSTNAW